MADKRIRLAINQHSLSPLPLQIPFKSVSIVTQFPRNLHVYRMGRRTVLNVIDGNEYVMAGSKFPDSYYSNVEYHYNQRLIIFIIILPSRIGVVQSTRETQAGFGSIV